jgi:hypothetical protein
MAFEFRRETEQRKHDDDDEFHGASPRWVAARRKADGRGGRVAGGRRDDGYASQSNRNPLAIRYAYVASISSSS